MLLLYLAGELPADQRAEAERQLAADAALRAELDRLRETYGWLEGALAASDAAAGPAPSQAVAVRRVGQAVRRWHAERLARPPADARPRRGDRSVLVSLLRRQWVYPAAAAAVVLMTFLASWSSRPIPTGTVIPEEDGGRPAVAIDDRGEFPLPPPQQPGNDPYVQLLALGPSTSEQLDLSEAERQMSALTALPEDVSAGVIPDFSAE